MSPRLCLECDKKLTGRSDQKFCSDACRVAFHNRNGAARKSVVKTVNQILLKNYKTLLQLNRTGKTRVTRATLRKSRFDFDHFTGIFESNSGKTYYYCYDQGYTRLDGDLYLLVVKTPGGIRESRKA